MAVQQRCSFKVVCAAFKFGSSIIGCLPRSTIPFAIRAERKNLLIFTLNTSVLLFFCFFAFNGQQDQFFVQMFFFLLLFLQLLAGEGCYLEFKKKK